MNINNFFKWFFLIPEEPRSCTKVIYWWESRRIPYNLIVGFIGSIGVLFYYLFIDLAHELKTGEDAIEPFVFIVAPFVINICYTAGWIVELILRIFMSKCRSQIGPRLLKLGLVFSIIIIFLPSITWFAIWVARS